MTFFLDTELFKIYRVIEILDKEVIGKVGKGYSDTLRTIIMNWLSEQGYLAKGGKQEKHLPENSPSNSG